MSRCPLLSPAAAVSASASCPVRFKPLCHFRVWSTLCAARRHLAPSGGTAPHESVSASARVSRRVAPLSGYDVTAKCAAMPTVLLSSADVFLICCSTKANGQIAPVLEAQIHSLRVARGPSPHVASERSPSALCLCVFPKFAI